VGGTHLPHLSDRCSRPGRIGPCPGHYQGTARLIGVGEGQPKPSKLWGEGCVEPSRLCPDPPPNHAARAPALTLGGGPALPAPSPSPSLRPPERQSHRSVLCPASFSPGGKHGRTDGQPDGWGRAGAGSLPAGVWTLQKSKSSTAVSEK